LVMTLLHRVGNLTSFRSLDLRNCAAQLISFCFLLAYYQ
jgi:hypothetical protein